MVQDKLHLSSAEGEKAIDATFGCQTRETGLFHSQAVITLTLTLTLILTLNLTLTLTYP